MKFLMKVGDQLDLNVAYNGGAADSGLLYTAPENNGVVSVVGATGVVTALSAGDTVVSVFHGTPSVLVATLIFEVVGVAEYAERLAIRQGDNPVVIGSAVVPQGPILSLFSPLGITAMEQNGYKLAWSGVYFGGMWFNAGYLEIDAIKFFDGNASTGFDNTDNNAAPRRNSLLIVPPIKKKFKKIEVDRNTITGSHSIQVFGRNGSTERNFEGSWTELCNFELHNFASFELQQDSIEYDAYQIQHYQNYNSGIKISEIRLYGTN